MPCSEKRARKLLAAGRARVHRVVPFVVRLVDRQQADCKLQLLRIKLDPGSKVTGVAVARETETINPSSGETERSAVVLNLLEINHRGSRISEVLTARRQMRRRRRGNLRYRAPRFLNRRNQGKGWLAPSLQHRIDTVVSWVNRLRRWAPVTALSQELVRFDTQALQNPEIAGIEYQQGTLAGYEAREYLLEKWGRRCAYCSKVGIPLQIEHIHPKARGGTNRISNLTLACEACNLKKGAHSIEDFLDGRPETLKRIRAQASRPLKDAAAVNTTRWALANVLKKTGLPVELASGGRTKFNRVRLGIPKQHALDAACVGQVTIVTDWHRPLLTIKCTGRGSYQRTRMDRFGFPRSYLMRSKSVHGFVTGDLVRAEVPSGTKAGLLWGRVAVRASGSFNIQTSTITVQGISYRHCTLVQRGDGYGYAQQTKIAN